VKRWTQRPCAACGRLAWGLLCRACRSAAHPAAPRRRALSGDWAERKRRAAAVAAHRREYGDVCPGWGRPAHPATNLAADHIEEVHAGGDEHGPLQILCGSCNSAKSNAIRAGKQPVPARTHDARASASRPW